MLGGCALMMASRRQVTVETFPVLENTADQSSYTFTDIPIGTPHPNRMVVLGIATLRIFPQRSVTGVTINGVTAGVVASTTAFGMGLAHLNVPNGTLADVTVNMSGITGQIQLATWSVRGLSSYTRLDEDADINQSPSTFFPSTQPGDLLIGMLKSTDGAVAWSGATEDFDGQGDPNAPVSGAHGFATGATATVGVTTVSTDTHLLVGQWR